VLSAHQGGGELLRPMPLEITRCLRVSGVELTPPPMRRGPDRVVAIDTPWPNGQACYSCDRRHLVPASGYQRALPSTRLRALAWAPSRDLCRLRLPVEGGDSPFFPSP
jgi:hypothetical protein